MIFHWWKSTFKGICLLQEIHCTVDQEEKWGMGNGEWGGHIEFCHGSSKSKGVAILYTPKFDLTVEKKVQGGGNFVVQDITLKEQHYLLINMLQPRIIH